MLCRGVPREKATCHPSSIGNPVWHQERPPHLSHSLVFFVSVREESRDIILTTISQTPATILFFENSQEKATCQLSSFLHWKPSECGTKRALLKSSSQSQAGLPCLSERQVDKQLKDKSWNVTLTTISPDVGNNCICVFLLIQDLEPCQGVREEGSVINGCVC